MRKLSPKNSALLVTVFLHLPFLLLTLQMPTYPKLPPLEAVELSFYLERALEVALVKSEAASDEWEWQSFGLPPPLNPTAPPPLFYTSYVLIDAREGKILWAKPDPLFDKELSSLRFVPSLTGGIQGGYLASVPKVTKEMTQER